MVNSSVQNPKVLWSSMKLTSEQFTERKKACTTNRDDGYFSRWHPIISSGRPNDEDPKIKKTECRLVSWSNVSILFTFSTNYLSLRLFSSSQLLWTVFLFEINSERFDAGPNRLELVEWFEWPISSGGFKFSLVNEFLQHTLMFQNIFY